MGKPNPARDARNVRDGYKDLKDALGGNMQGVQDRATARANERAAEMAKASQAGMEARRAEADAKARRQSLVQRRHAYVEALLGKFGATPEDIQQYRNRAYPPESEAMRIFKGNSR